MRNSLSRRIALKRPSSSELEALEAEIARQEELEDRDEAALEVLRAQRDAILARQRRISYIDPIDLRYRRYEPTPRMVTQAALLCLMEVSGATTDTMKDLAKRVFALLHLFRHPNYHLVVLFITPTKNRED